MANKDIQTRETTFVKVYSDLLASHQMKCDCAWPTWQHGGSVVTER
jgi:hypothetical protein